MSCQKIHNKQEAEQYLGKRVIIYHQTLDLYDGTWYTASVSGTIQMADDHVLHLNWYDKPIRYEKIKRIVVRENSNA